MTHFSVGPSFMLRCISFPVSAIVAAAALVFLSATAFPQQPVEQKPPEQAQQGGQNEQKPEGEQLAADADKAEQEAAARAVAEYKEAEAKLPRSSGAAECIWTGRRIA